MIRFGPTWLLERLATRRAPQRAGLSTAALGEVGEELAARFLLRRGMQLVGRNVRAPEAELDIVAWEGREVVVVEVKTGVWQGPSAELQSPMRHRRPSERVTSRDVTRRQRAAGRMAAARQDGSTGRVDVVEVIVGRGRRPIRIVHHRAASTAVNRP